MTTDHANDDHTDPLEEILLGGPRKYTRLEIAERSGVSLDYARRLWRAMGFPDAADDDRIFTDGDLNALQTLRELEAKGLIDEETALTSTRAMGQQMARLADWQVNILTERLKDLGATDLGATAKPKDLEALVAEVADDVLPDLERILVTVWRRQLAANAPRALAAALGEADSGTLTVGFADMVNYTRLSRVVDSEKLGHLLEDFETRATLLMAEYGGRIVKTLGDEVFFVADEARAAAEIALRLVESHSKDQDLPDLRAGLACGPVLSRYGDVFGEPVNIASRLTSLARPGTVLVDRAVATALAEEPAYALRSLGRHRVKGYSNLELTVLRRANVNGKEKEDE
ncbi:MAG: adenylate cyclase [Frankiales bacterium]|nr:adenylate cyclase [Frankiales bacterium]